MKKIDLPFPLKKEEKKAKAYRGNSGAIYLQSKHGDWFCFSSEGNISRCNPVSGDSCWYTPIEGPVTLTFHQY